MKLLYNFWILDSRYKWNQCSTQSLNEVENNLSDIGSKNQIIGMWYTQDIFTGCAAA